MAALTAHKIDPLALERQVCFALATTNRAVLAVYRPLLEPLGLTHPQYLVMLALWERDGVPVKDIGERLFLDSGTLTPLLKRLEAMGHLTRQRDPKDERQVRVRLTPEGRKVRERALAFRSELVRAMGLDAADFQHLREELVKLRTNLSTAT